MNKLKVIITSTTRMVGDGVMYKCLHHPEVEKKDMKILVKAGNVK